MELIATALRAPNVAHPVPSPNVRVSTVSDDIYPCTDVMLEAVSEEVTELAVVNVVRYDAVVLRS